MPFSFEKLLARKDKRLTSHTTLQVYINSPELQRSYYFATATLTANGVNWKPYLRKGSQIKSSLSKAADTAIVGLANADLALGVELLKIRQYLYGAEMIVGRYWKDLDSGVEVHKTLFTGVVAYSVPQIDENLVTIAGVSTAYANISVGASRRVNLLCSWLYKDPSTCHYRGAQETCNLMIDHADGCHGRHGDPYKRAAIGAFAYLNSGNRLQTV
jgi:hypothetical protein